MKKICAALGWLLLFTAFGCGVMAGLASVLLPHRLPLHAALTIAGMGALPAVLVWTIALCFAALPGARRAPGAAGHFGLAQGLWAMLCTALLMLCGGALPYVTAVYLMLVRMMRHLPAHMPDRHETELLLASLLASELMAALWLAWYARRQGPDVLADGAATGIGWRPAAARAYMAAGLCALAVLTLAALEIRLDPPDVSRLHDLDIDRLFQGPLAIALTAGGVAVILAPFIEEGLFRGIAFAGIARGLGPVWAVAITTLIFTAAHAPEKIYYLPGFADVAAVALLSCALRLRYRSIKPGILMHFLYNFGMFVVPAVAGAH
jgi:membrane protease YdiL (CAAX protease family)